VTTGELVGIALGAVGALGFLVFLIDKVATRPKLRLSVAEPIIKYNNKQVGINVENVPTILFWERNTAMKVTLSYEVSRAGQSQLKLVSSLGCWRIGEQIGGKVIDIGHREKYCIMLATKNEGDSSCSVIGDGVKLSVGLYLVEWVLRRGQIQVGKGKLLLSNSGAGLDALTLRTEDCK